jgi:hypothetical protein
MDTVLNTFYLSITKLHVKLNPNWCGPGLGKWTLGALSH